MTTMPRFEWRAALWALRDTVAHGGWVAVLATSVCVWVGIVLRVLRGETKE